MQDALFADSILNNITLLQYSKRNCDNSSGVQKCKLLNPTIMWSGGNVGQRQLIAFFKGLYGTLPSNLALFNFSIDFFSEELSKGQLSVLQKIKPLLLGPTTCYHCAISNCGNGSRGNCRNGNTRKSYGEKKGAYRRLYELQFSEAEVV